MNSFTLINSRIYLFDNIKCGFFTDYIFYDTKYSFHYFAELKNKDIKNTRVRLG